MDKCNPNKAMNVLLRRIGEFIMRQLVFTFVLFVSCVFILGYIASLDDNSSSSEQVVDAVQEIQEMQPSKMDFAKACSTDLRSNSLSVMARYSKLG